MITPVPLSQPSSVTCYVTCNVTRHATISRWAGREFTTRRPGQPFVRWQSSSSPKAERPLSRCVPSQRGRAPAREPSTACSGRRRGFSSTRSRRTRTAFLADGMDNTLETDDPAADLVEMGVSVYRRLVLEHPALYRIAFQRIVPDVRAGPELTEARERSLSRLLAKVQRVADAGQLGSMSVRDGAVAFNAMCEGLANSELRGTTLSILPQAKRNAPGATPSRRWSEASTRTAAEAVQHPQMGTQRSALASRSSGSGPFPTDMEGEHHPSRGTHRSADGVELIHLPRDCCVRHGRHRGSSELSMEAAGIEPASAVVPTELLRA